MTKKCDHPTFRLLILGFFKESEVLVFYTIPITTEQNPMDKFFIFIINYNINKHQYKFIRTYLL